MVEGYCISKCKKFSACDMFLIALWAIFFTIQNGYVNWNPDHYTLLQPNKNIYRKQKHWEKGIQQYAKFTSSY